MYNILQLGIATVFAQVVDNVQTKCRHGVDNVWTSSRQCADNV